MSHKESFDVAVIGAGVVGTTAALMAARRGLRVALVEAKAPNPWREEQPDLRVYALAEDNRALLERLGVWHAIASARAHPYRKMRVWDAGGSGELMFDADALGRSTLGHIVENDLLVDRLLAAAQSEANLRWLCPDRVEALQQEAAAVHVSLHSGLKLQARLLVAADGAASPTRDRLGIECDAKDYGQRALVAYVRSECSHEDTAWQRFLPGGPLAFLPCADGRCSIVWSLPEAGCARLLALEPNSFRQELTRAFDARLGEVVEVSERVAFPLRRQLARSYQKGRVVLIGDAAHAVHPLAGQGVNLGLRDVAALQEVIAKAQARQSDIGAEHRLANWARERRSEAALAAYAFEGINWLFSNDAVLPTLMRGPLLGLAGRVPLLPQALWAHASGS